MLWWMIPVTLAVLLTLAYINAPGLAWTAAFGALLALSPWFMPLSMPVFTALFAGYAILAALLNLPALRQRVISNPLLALYRKILPPMSDRKSTRLNSSHPRLSRMPSSA